MDNASLTLDALTDVIQSVVNATTPIWYGTSDMMTRGKILASLESTPPFVIIHPDDVSLLPADARHLRDYRPTHAELLAQAEQWREEVLNQPIVYEPEIPQFILRCRLW